VCVCVRAFQWRVEQEAVQLFVRTGSVLNEWRCELLYRCVHCKLLHRCAFCCVDGVCNAYRCVDGVCNAYCCVDGVWNDFCCVDGVCNACWITVYRATAYAHLSTNRHRLSSASVWQLNS
jgi:hypothetical protein